MKTIDERLKTKFPSEFSRAVVNVLYTASWISLQHTNALKPFGISAQQYNVLRILRGFGDWMTMNDIKSRMIDQAPNITRLTDKLIEKELMERKRCDQDRRVVFGKINTKGLQFLKKIDESDNKKLTIVSEKITEEEAQQLSALLDKMRNE